MYYVGDYVDFVNNYNFDSIYVVVKKKYYNIDIK